MTQRRFLTIASAVALIYGFGFVFVPSLLATLYGIDATPPLLMMNRFFGVALLGLAATCWTLKDAVEDRQTAGLMITLGLSNLLGTFVALHATLTHQINALGWLSVLVYGGLTAGCALVYRNAGYRFKLV